MVRQGETWWRLCDEVLLQWLVSRNFVSLRSEQVMSRDEGVYE